jgi:YidC/Oxa1 family membrane protein insertase
MSMGVMLLFSRIFPPPPPPAAPQPGAAAAPAADGKDLPKANVAAADAGAKVEEKPKDAVEQPVAKPGPLPAVAAVDTPVQFVTLGSLDMNSDYRMLVTLTNAGAALHRAEMASTRFRDQHDWSGYLGELELNNVPGGVQVRVVGAGTPAANATVDGKPAAIEPGDVIVGIGSSQTTAIKNADDLKRELAKSQPGQEMSILIRRGDAAPQARQVRLTRRPLAVLRPEIENYALRDATVPADFVDRPSFLLTLASLDNHPLAKDEAKRLAELLESGTWELAEHDDKSAAFRRVLPELKLEIVKRYTLSKSPPEARDDPNFPAYSLQLEVELKNTGDAKRSAAYRLDGPTGMPLEGWWYARKISQRWGGGGLRDVAVRFAGSPEVAFDDAQIAKGKVPSMGDGQALAYAGVDGQYFSAILIPQIQALDDVWFDTTEAIVVGPTPDVRAMAFTNVTSRMTRKSIDLAAGASLKDKYQVFIGPKRPDLLARYYAANDPNYSLKDLLYYGWPIFGAVARSMLYVLHLFYGIVGNYGVAIVMLTILVRGAMFPISFKQTQNMARMQALKPEMDRINEKYKTDMQKKSQATQELYRKHKINPLGGCLPVFLQLPIFIGLYRALSVDVELRQSPLFGNAVRWCSNLAAPDMLWNWSAIMPESVSKAQGLFGLGPYLNVLPLVTVGFFLVTQKMAMPAPTNEQAAMQQKMMKYMTMFMGLMFYKVASGLCLYFIASSIWGIAERKLLPKPKSADSAASGSVSSSGKGSNGSGSKPGSNGSPDSKKTGKAKRKK